MMPNTLMHLPEQQLTPARSHDDMYFDAASDLSSPLSSIPSSPLSSPPNSPTLPPTWRSLTPPPSQDNADDDMPPARKRRKVEPKPRTTQHLDLSSDTSQSEYDHRVALNLLLKTLRKRRKIVVVAGAGISVSAGIPDFRSSHGLFKTLRREHKLKGSGKELFDASVYKDDSSTSSFHDMLRDLSNMAAKATPTPFHHLVARLAQEGRLLRLYTQNIDGIDTSLPPLATQVPLNHKGPWPQTIQLHGGLEKMMCQKCRHTSDFQADLFQGPKPPSCPECEVKDTLRTSHAGKRSHGIGKLRPRIVLYQEHNPDDEAIGAVMTSDLRSRPDAIVVVGTSMKIPGVRRLVREMCGVVRSKQNGISMWINQDPVPPGKDFEDCWDLVVSGECDEVARQADFKNWDDASSETMEEYTLSEGERVKSSQGEIKVVVPGTPSKNMDRMKKGLLKLGGMMTPPVSMDDEMSDRPQASNLEKKSRKNSPAKTKLKFVVKNPASLGRSISEVLGKENTAKHSGRQKGSLNKRTVPKVKLASAQAVITGKVTKPVSISKATPPIKEQKAPLSPRSNINSNVLLFPNVSQQYSSTEPSPAPESPTENEWRNRDTISPNGSIPNVAFPGAFLQKRRDNYATNSIPYGTTLCLWSLMEERLSFGSDVLATTSGNPLNLRPGSVQPHKKRKREDYEQHDSLNTIEAKTLPESRTNESLTLVLIAKLPQSKLSFGWLDAAPPSTQVPARLIFHAELSTTTHSHSVDGEDDIVWICRQAPNRRLYAVESIGDNTHVGCLLASWVTEAEVIAGRGSLSKNALLERLLNSQQVLEEREISSRPSSQHGVPVQPFRASPKKPKNRRGVLARMSIMPSKETTPVSHSPVLPEVGQRQQPMELDTSQPTVDRNCARHIMPTTHTTPAQDVYLTFSNNQNSTRQPSQQQSEQLVRSEPVDVVPPSTQTILETLHRQYLETLYTSKISLAYFAKGPLVRARIQVQSNLASQVSDLADFCRVSIIPTKKMDLKYRESIVNILQSLALPDASKGAEELQKASTKSKTKQKSSRQRKLGKDGLYPAEKEFIVSWWNCRTLRDYDVPTGESRTGEMKSAVADLRSRETAMQILLVLEALALEASEIASVSDKASKALIKEERLESGQEAMLIELPQLRKSKRQDLVSELELLVDRLCIWHTIGLEHVSNPSDGNQEVESGLGFPSKDRLRDFCSDVIIPFYSARLPEHCKTICQKLGGPQISPKRPRKTLQKSLSSSRVLPGAAVKAPHGSISRRTLQRVLSEDQSSRHASPPILSRSSTTPLVPNLKRETTEPPPRPESRGGLQKSRSFANREIDLVGDARTQDVKQKKLANLAKQKREIDAAISALRKPNRGLAAKEIADEIDGHRLESGSLLKHRGLGIQVNATPKKSKTSGAVQGTGFQSSIHDIRALPDVPVNELSVPSSTMRPSMAEQLHDWAPVSTVGRAVPIAVDDPPVQDAWQRPARLGIAKDSRVFDISTVDGDEPAHTDEVEYNATSLIQATPSTSRLRPDMLTSIQNTPLRMKKSQRPVLLTAMRKADIRIEDVFKDAPAIPEQAGRAMARVMGGGNDLSIYDSLGWNDEFDE